MKKQDPNFAQHKIPLVKIGPDGKWVDDPINPSNNHFCTPKTTDELFASQADRRQRQKIRSQGVRPLKAYAQLKATVSEEFQHDHQARDRVFRLNC